MPISNLAEVLQDAFVVVKQFGRKLYILAIVRAWVQGHAQSMPERNAKNFLTKTTSWGGYNDNFVDTHFYGRAV